MSEFLKTNLLLDHKFDRRTNRHFLNGFVSVMHCHHYSTLYTQLAIDAKETDLLANVSEETFYDVLANYFEDYGVDELDEKIAIACQYFSAVGLGKMEVVFAGDFSGEVVLHHSHLDEGWLKKWGKFDRPVNYVAAGYIAAMFDLLFEASLGSFLVVERESIVMGAGQSVFYIERK